MFQGANQNIDMENQKMSNGASKISKDEAWKIYETLPKDLKQAIFSEETANVILSACQRNGLTEQQIPKVAETVGYSLMGLLPIENFAEEIEKTLAIPKEKSSQIFNEINRLVFYPAKNSLDGIYMKQQPTPAPAQKSKPAEPDTYRESVE